MKEGHIWTILRFVNSEPHVHQVNATEEAAKRQCEYYMAINSCSCVMLIDPTNMWKVVHQITEIK